MKGAVLIIGSLLWETELNSLNKTQGKLREEWRRNLDLENKIFVKAPIRYGKRSSTRKCTYTMVFSNSVASSGTAVIIPYKKATNDFNELKEQAIALSKAEGISNEKYPNRLISSWGAVGIYFNKQKYNNEADVKMNWHQEYNQFNNMDYKIPPEIPAISENGEINFNIIIPDIFDLLLLSRTKYTPEYFYFINSCINCHNGNVWFGYWNNCIIINK